MSVTPTSQRLRKDLMQVNRTSSSPPGDGDGRASPIAVAPGTIVVFADLACPWAHVAVYRLHATRARLGFQGKVLLDARAFPLELINEQATPKRILDAEIPVVGGLEPDAGWQMWQRPVEEWPVTTLLAMEAVEAAKEQGLKASEDLDRALRLALFAESRTVSLRHEILDVAATCEGVDVGTLKDALIEGRARPAIERQLDISRSNAVEGSPHLFLPDGTNVHNPGIERHWEGEVGVGFPVVDRDEPALFEELLQRAAQ
jgi:predicted DsbA family dithiol-disulfide isomerase